MRVLLVEDDPLLADNVLEFLEGFGHEVDLAVDGRSALTLALSSRHDVLVLDVGLPRLDGLEICRRLRKERGPDVPVLLLTARDTLEDKLAGFAAGADDYVVKPFEMRELAARLEVLHRRAVRVPAVGGVQRVADLEFDPGAWEFRRAGDLVVLNRIGRRILRLLFERSPNVLSREDLEREVWGAHPPAANVVRTHLYAIRKAIHREGADELIHTIHGIGYRLAEPGPGEVGGA